MILKSWLGGLDSNQDNQIQSLMYCQLYDLPILASGHSTTTAVKKLDAVRRLATAQGYQNSRQSQYPAAGFPSSPAHSIEKSWPSCLRTRYFRSNS